MIKGVIKMTVKELIKILQEHNVDPNSKVMTFKPDTDVTKIHIMGEVQAIIESVDTKIYIIGDKA